MAIYEVDSLIDELSDAWIDPETGEIVLHLDELLQAAESNEKLYESLALKIKNLKYEAENIKAEIDILNDRKKSIEKNMESTKKYLDYLLSGQNFSTAKCKVSFKKNPPATQISDPDALLKWAKEHFRDDLIKTTIKEEPSKAAIYATLNAGGEVPYAQIVQTTRMEIK